MRSTRLVAAAALAVLGVAAVAAGLIGVSHVAAGSIAPLRQALTSSDAQRFAFDRQAWRAVSLDDVFPPVYQSTTAAPMPGATRQFTRLGVAASTGCAKALDAGLVRLLSTAGCGPVMRADYTDATRTMVATVGIAVLGANPTEERDLHAATTSQHDDLRPRAVAFPGTAAAAFGDTQRVAFRVLASDRAPFLSFAVVGFGDGRAASADRELDAADGSGAKLTAVDLEDMVGTRMEEATDRLWARQR
jgi:hypothetical protein